MILSIVSGTYNRLPLLQQMMESARASVPEGIEYEFVLVDGGSTDGTIAWLYGEPDTTVIEHGELRGAIAAFCDGAKAASGEYVLLANDDIAFIRDSIARAIDYLDHVPKCGGVAFADNRPAPPFKYSDTYQVMLMPALKNEQETLVYYAQVGLFRRWLGDECGWWGADNPDFPAKTYAGDNYLSSRIWERGYTIDEVDACRVLDSVHADGLREINIAGLTGNRHPDSDAYYNLYPRGAVIPSEIELEPNPERLRTLYLPIFDHAHPIQREQKRGLYDALSEIGWCYEYDYLEKTPSELLNRLGTTIERIQPDLMVTQLHSADVITPQMMKLLRKFAPQMVVINWNGDYWPHSLVDEKIMLLLREIDLQLIVNADVLKVYEKEGIAAAYWQIGYEEVTRDVKVNQYDVVFLANMNDRKRQELEFALPEISLFGNGWKFAKGECLYDFDTGAAIYRNAKLSIGDNLFAQNRAFVSNRMFQALAAGGAMYMQQYVDGLDDLTGFKAGKHYVEWIDFTDLREKINYYLEHEAERLKIAKLGTRYCRRYHSFDAKVKELFERIIPDAIG